MMACIWNKYLSRSIGIGTMVKIMHRSAMDRPLHTEKLTDGIAPPLQLPRCRSGDGHRPTKNRAVLASVLLVLRPGLPKGDAVDPRTGGNALRRTDGQSA